MFPQCRSQYLLDSYKHVVNHERPFQESNLSNRPIFQCYLVHTSFCKMDILEFDDLDLVEYSVKRCLKCRYIVKQKL